MAEEHPQPEVHVQPQVRLVNAPESGIKSPWIIYGTFLCMFLLVVAITTIMWNQRDRSNSNAKLISEFSGTGTTETDPFSVKNPWEIRWEHSGHIKAIEWISSNNKSEALVEMHKKPIRNHGQRYIGLDGEFKLKITAEGPWKIKVWQYLKK